MRGFLLMFTTMILLPTAVLSDTIRGAYDCSSVDSSGNCWIQQDNIYMENNTEYYRVRLDVGTSFGDHMYDPTINESVHYNYGSNADGYNSYYGEGTLEFAVNYVSDYDKDSVVNMILPLSLGIPVEYYRDFVLTDVGTQFNHNIGLNADKRLNELKLTPFTLGAFRINGNVFINNLTNDEYDHRNRDSLETHYGDVVQLIINDDSMIDTLNDTEISDPRNASSGIYSSFASDIFDVTNPINLHITEAAHMRKTIGGGSSGLSFLFDNTNSNYKVINAQFGVESKKMELLSIENNRSIAEGAVWANFGRDIYANSLQLRTELRPTENIHSRLSSEIYLNFQDINVNIDNINIGTKSPETLPKDIRYLPDGVEWFAPTDYKFNENYIMNAPYSQISGSILLNNSKITGENFNIGNHGKIYISTSGADSLIASDNTSFGINSKIIIYTDSVAENITNRTILTSVNTIKDSSGLQLDEDTGEFISSTGMSVGKLQNIVQLNPASTFLYDLDALFYNDGEDVSSNPDSEVDKIIYNTSLKSNPNNIISNIFSVDGNKLDSVKDILNFKTTRSQVEDFISDTSDVKNRDNFISTGYITNRSNNIISNRVFSQMTDPNINNNLSNSFSNQKFSNLQNIFNNIYQKNYSNIDDNLNNINNFSELMSSDITDFYNSDGYNIWIQPFGGIYNYTAGDAFQSNIYGILTGLDKKYSDILDTDYNAIFGLSYGYFVSDIDSPGDSNLEVASNQISFYNANYHNSGLGLYNKNIISLSLNNNNLRRVVTDNNISVVDANADYNSNQYSISSSIGYLSNIGKRVVISPELTFGYNYFPDYSYVEKGNGAMNINVKGDSYDNIFTNLSVKLSGKHKYRELEKKKYTKNKKITSKSDLDLKGKLVPKYEYSLNPSITLSWLKNYNDDGRNHQVKFNNIPNMDIITQSSSNLLTDIYSANLGLEILELNRGGMVDLSYILDSGDDYLGHSFYIKYSKRF